MPVTIITRVEKNASHFKKNGAEIAVVDVYDEEELKKVFKKGKALFFLNPPADPSSDMEKKERESVKNILSALEAAPIEKVVAQSTYGAQEGHNIGDFGVWNNLSH